MRNCVYSVIHLTKPRSELEIYVFINSDHVSLSLPGERGGVYKVRFEKVNKLLKNFVFDRAIQAQRALLANLKVCLEKS